jgi:hypothetical protein
VIWFTLAGASAGGGGWGKFALIAESLPRDCAAAAPCSAIGSHPPAPEARRRGSRRGCPAPITHPIANDIAICAVTALAATATMTDYTGKDISGEINHGDIRFTAIVSLR